MPGFLNPDPFEPLSFNSLDHTSHLYLTMGSSPKDHFQRPSIFKDSFRQLRKIPIVDHNFDAVVAKVVPLRVDETW